MEMINKFYNNKEVRVVMVEGDPWFVAKDICDVLGVQLTHRAMATLDDDEKGRHTVTTLGGDQEMSVINEAGMYSLVLKSRKPEAKQFKRWITHEVIPDIRKHGQYMTVETADATLENPEVFLSKSLLYANEVIERQKKLLAHFEEDAENIYIGDMSKILQNCGIDVKPFTLAQWLRNKGWLMKHYSQNAPTQAAVRQGMLTAKHKIQNVVALITPKGQLHIMKHFLHA